MTIRVRTDADLPACVTALRAVYETSGYPTAWPPDPSAWLTPDGLLQSWVAEHEGAIVGQVGVVAGTTEPALAAATGVPAGELALVTRLYVNPVARGRGLARELIRTVSGFGTDNELRVGLDVMEASVEAIALYESLGWQLHGRAQAEWRTQNGQRPMIRYYLAPG